MSGRLVPHDTGFLLLFLLTAALAVLGIAWHVARSRDLLERWVRANGYALLDARRCWLWRGPFFLRSTDGQVVFRVHVEDEQGRTRRGHVRVGGWLLGLFSDRTTVVWDREDHGEA